VVSIAVQVTPESIAVTVSDTGSGVGPDDLPKIFDRFYKGPTSHGSGLGLTIARNLVVAHGGEIHAESELGRGTRLTFSVPVNEATAR
jgi:signal transduction histidine kinase